MNLCVCDNEEWSHGVCAGVNDTILSSAKNRNHKTRRICHKDVLVAKNPMNLCVCDIEEREHGVDSDVNATCCQKD
jgi:hypothetical protein